MDTRWRYPFTCCVCGPTGYGKTLFVKRFLDYLPEVCDARFDRVLFYYAEWEDAYRWDFKPNGAPIKFREGLPQLADYSSDNEKRKLLILDDLMRESSSDVILDLFTKGSHHKNIIVIFVTQNVFHKGKAHRDISLNTKYLVLFKNPRDRAQIQHLARQIFPTREPHLFTFFSISLKPAWTSLDFEQKYFPMTVLTLRTCPSTLNHAEWSVC